MQLMTWVSTPNLGVVCPGIDVQMDRDLRLCIRLGKDNGGVLRKMGIHRDNPPEIQNDRVMHAEIRDLTVRRGTNQEYVQPVLSNANGFVSDGRVLVRVITKWEDWVDLDGSWKSFLGTPEVILLGEGKDKHRSTWWDGLVVMKPRDALLIFIQGKPIYQSEVLFYDPEDGLNSMPLSQWENM